MKKFVYLCLVLLALSSCAKKEVKDMANGCDVNGACAVDFASTSDYENHLKNGKFTKISFKEVLGKIDNKEDFLVIYSFSTCPWCVALMPELSKLTNEYDQNVYYVDVRPEGVDLRTEDNMDYVANYEKVKEIAKKDKIYVPAFVKFVKGEAVMYHEGTLEDHNAKEEALSQAQKTALIDILSNFFK